MLKGKKKPVPISKVILESMIEVLISLPSVELLISNWYFCCMSLAQCHEDRGTRRSLLGPNAKFIVLFNSQ